MYFKLEIKLKDDSLVQIREGFISPDRISLGSQLTIGYWNDSYETEPITMYMHDPVTNIWEFMTADGYEYVLTPIEQPKKDYIN